MSQISKTKSEDTTVTEKEIIKKHLERIQNTTAEYLFDRMLNVMKMLENLLKRVDEKTELAIFLTNTSGDFRMGMDDNLDKIEEVSLEDRLEALE